MADLEGLLDRLLRERVEFVVVGGFAAVTHGASLLAFDLDVCGTADKLPDSLRFPPMSDGSKPGTGCSRGVRAPEVEEEARLRP